MKRNIVNQTSGFTLIELLVVVAIIGILSSVVLASVGRARIKAQDSTRLSQVRQIKYALELYYDANNNYPTCLNAVAGCGSTLAGSIYMKVVPTDPLTRINYSYAAIGSGTVCSSVHIGASLAEKTNKALLTGADATPKSICSSSTPEFSGLSYAAPGQPCNTTAGTAQPTAAADGETCYDLN
jgi:prepilin-type N-terminal cleavage/methylation domain-containing protein